MDKRTFLKTCSALMAGGILSPLASCRPEEAARPRTNWAGNLTYSTDRLHLPQTVAEAQELVRNTPKLRPLGSRHCFNAIADSTEGQISLEHLNRVVHLDEASNRVTVGAGMRYGDLAPYLRPAFDMIQHVYLDLPVASLDDRFDEIMSSGYSVSLFTDWQTDAVNQVWIKRVAGDDAFEADPTFFGASLATRNVHPILELSAVNCTEQMGVRGPWYDRLPHFRMDFTPSSGKELQSEYFVPRERARDVARLFQGMGDRLAPLLMISEVRTIDKDDLWMSTCFDRSSVAFHFTWEQDWDALRQLLPVIEEALAPFEARPHWGKLFTIPPDRLQSRYEKVAAFRELLQEYDPDGKFRNVFLQENLFGG